MTDKQIIIDSVDVSGCKYYVENNGIEAQGCYELTDLCECNNENEFCDNNPNCYYKNWQRKEQECEELKEQLTILDDEDVVVEITVKQFEEYKKLKAENEDLKKSILQECPNCGEEYLNYKGVELYYENYDLKQTLTEIKKIANKFDYWNSNLSQASEILHEIIEKISECEGNDE